MEARALRPAPVRERRFKAGEAVSLEDDALWRISSGELELSGVDPSGGRHPVARLGPGELVSSALLDDRRLGARAASDVVLGGVAAEEREVEGLRAVLARLRDQLVARTAERHERVLIGRFLWSLVLIVCLYLALLGMPSVLARLPDSAWLSVPLQALFLFETVRFLRRSGLPRAWFGLTTERAGRALLEGAGLAAVLCGGLWAVHVARPSLLMGLAGGSAADLSAPTVIVAALIYGLFSFVQELVVRGGVEPCFKLALTGRRRGLQAALLANLLFALMHLHLSWTMAVLSFLVGMTWSALYARHRTLVGVTASHLVVGLFVFFFAGRP